MEQAIMFQSRLELNIFSVSCNSFGPGFRYLELDRYLLISVVSFIVVVKRTYDLKLFTII